ncbi:hypothetical protein BpHYR1_007506 [Brachionus plicatilis]|uniref:Uncharacterized protein n=1 Tax=Brachionus plicatilis TaxID=10195 RepID=A0A3M7QW56_BRAPC|nr:hypothetical protein BpHYR1_007506 [Brachionus plicatilis]
MYMKHNKICWDLLSFLHVNYSTFEQKNSSYCKQLKHVEVYDQMIKCSIKKVQIRKTFVL